MISEADQSKSCLNDEQILKLSNIGVLLEKLYGNARDIEWAVHKVCTHIHRECLSGSLILSSSECILPATIKTNHHSKFIQ